MNDTVKKVLSIAALVATSVVGTLISTTMQDRGIEKYVNKHFEEQESKKEEA